MNNHGLLPAACALCVLLLLAGGGWLRRSLRAAEGSALDCHRNCLEQARALIDAGDAWAAARLLGRGIRQWPDQIELLLARAALLTALDHRLGAYRDYTQALQLDPECIEALHGRARLRLRGLDCEGALDDLERAARLAPHNRRCRELLRLVLARLATARSPG